MILMLFTIAITYVLTNLFGYIVHWSLHQKWSGPIYKSHMTHHLKLYPADDYLSDVYRNPGKDNTVKIFAIAAIIPVALLLLSSFLGFISISTLIVVIITLLIIAFLHNHFHDSFHIKNHWLNKLKIFRKWNELHYLHHVDMNVNYGIFTFFLDRICGTFRKL